MAYIFDLPASPRYQIYFSFILWLFVMPIFAFFWFMIYYLFYFDEYKYESLDYDDFIDDYLDLFAMDPHDDVEKAFKNAETLRDYYEGKQLPDDLIIRDTSAASSDFEHERVAGEWDAAEVAYVLMIMDYLNEEWEYESEVELDDECDLKFDDLEQFYVFLHSNREVKASVGLNAHETITRLHLSNSGVCAKSVQHLKTTMREVPADVRLFLFHKDDFHFRYWRQQMQLQLLEQSKK